MAQVPVLDALAPAFAFAFESVIARAGDALPRAKAKAFAMAWGVNALALAFAFAFESVIARAGDEVPRAKAKALARACME